MSDLINREDVIKCLQENGWLDDTNIDELIETIPTAYSVDKVVEELEENASRYTKKYITPYGNNGYKDIKAISVKKAIKIVKQGGVGKDDVCEKDKGGGIMERLTKRIFVPTEERELVVFTKGKYIDTIPAEMTHEDIRKVLRKLAEYEDFEEIFREKMTDTACEFLKDKEEFGKWLDRNKWITKKCDEWVRAEEQGLLLRLPCKVGDTVYRINKGAKEPIIKMRIFQVHIKQLHKNRTIIRIDTINDEDMGEGCYLTDDFGKNVFLTKAEAEQKLKEMESD